MTTQAHTLGKWGRDDPDSKVYTNVSNYGVFPDTGLDVSANLQLAINSGMSLAFTDGEYYANNLTQSTNNQKFYGFSDVRILKNANGVLFASSGTGIEIHGIKFYGDTYTGDNVTFSGYGCSMFNSASRGASGRAVKATGDHFQLQGTNSIYQTADTTATGYDIEIGVTGTVTAYHQITGYYSSQHTGGILLIDTGSASVIGGQFGKLTIRSNTALGIAPGQNGGSIVGNRIGGAVIIEQASALFTSNLFGSGATIGLQSGAGGNGVSGVSIGASNGHAGATITSSANSANYIVREQGTNGTYDLVNTLFGPDAGASYTGIRTVIGNGTNPEGNVTAEVGSTYTSTVGGTLWLKESGSGNTGWKSYRGLYGTAVYDPANLVAGAAYVSTTVTVTGAALGDYVYASFGRNLQGVKMDAYVSAANTVTVTFQNVNTGGADVDLSQADIRCRVFPA